jgi:hypothetical protein
LRLSSILGPTHEGSSAAVLSHYLKLAEQLLTLGVEICARFSATEFFREAILHSPEWAEARSRFFNTPFGRTFGQSLFCQGEECHQERKSIHESKTCCFKEELSSHFKLTDAVRFLPGNSFLGSDKSAELSERKASLCMTMTCDLGIATAGPGKFESKVGRRSQPNDNGFEMSIRECFSHYFAGTGLSRSDELCSKEKVFGGSPIPLKWT